MSMFLYENFEIHAVVATASDTSNEVMQGACVKKYFCRKPRSPSLLLWIFPSLWMQLNFLISFFASLLIFQSIFFHMHEFGDIAENPVHKCENARVQSTQTTTVPVTNYTSNLECEHLFMRSSINAKKYFKRHIRIRTKTIFTHLIWRIAYILSRVLTTQTRGYSNARS